jgi:hypothetical protein
MLTLPIRAPHWGDPPRFRASGVHLPRAEQPKPPRSCIVHVSDPLPLWVGILICSCPAPLGCVPAFGRGMPLSRSRKPHRKPTRQMMKEATSGTEAGAAAGRLRGAEEARARAAAAAAQVHAWCDEGYAGALARYMVRHQCVVIMAWPY